jgi:UDP-N-acetyl-D-mannosaminuronic acid dehydrogenase
MQKRVDRLDSKTSKVTIIGLGYVGLTLAVVLAESGFKVNGIEKKDEIYDSLIIGKSHFYEEGIHERLVNLIANDAGEKFFEVSKTIHEHSDVWIVTVGTPLKNNGTKPAMEYLEQAATDMSEFLRAGDLVIIRSTVPVGTTRRTVIKILEQRSGLIAGEDFYVAYAPERTIEGAALNEIKELPQIIGGVNPQSVKAAESFFNCFAKECVVLRSLEEAEFTKLTDNTYRDLIFAYANQMSIIASKIGINFSEIVMAANYNYPRNKIPIPSPGVGGACLYKDPYLLQESAERYNISADLSIQGRAINKKMIHHIVEMIITKSDQISIEKSHTKIFFVGIAFKGMPPTSDIRDSTAVDLIKLFQSLGFVNMSGYDQYVEKETIQTLGIDFKEIKEGILSSNIILFLNNNPNYEQLPIHEYLAETLKPVIFFDGWNRFNSDIYRNVTGLHYIGL